MMFCLPRHRQQQKQPPRGCMEKAANPGLEYVYLIHASFLFSTSMYLYFRPIRILLGLRFLGRPYSIQ